MLESMAETCSCSNSRSFSWLVKSCLPDHTAPTPARRAPPLDRRRHHHDPSPSLSSLPDDLLLECLSRIPLSSLPSLSLVCRRFSHLLDSPAFLRLRRSSGLLRRTLYAFYPSNDGLALSLARSSPGSAWEFPEPPLLLPFPGGALGGCFSHCRLVPVGRCVYALGRGASFCYDTWRGTAAPTSPTLFPRKKFAAASIAGKVYVAGGSARTSSVEEYDPVSDAWRVVTEAPRRRYGCVGAAVDGIFYVIGGLKVGGGGGGGRLDAPAYAGTMDLYDVEARAWRRPRAVPGGGCVMGACAAGGRVYVLASHAVELSFWGWEGKAAGRGGRKGTGGECGWEWLPPPPVPQQARVGGAGRFACVGVGESSVVLLVHVSGEAGRRGARCCDGEGLVLVYDAVAGEWGRGTELPRALWRAACACVEC